MVIDLNIETSPQFEFRLPGSKKVWKLPSMDDLPLGIRDAIGKAAKPIAEAQKDGRKPTPEQLQALGEAQLKLLDSYCPGLRDVASSKALAAILQAWGEHSGIDLGESEASAS